VGLSGLVFSPDGSFGLCRSVARSQPCARHLRRISSRRHDRPEHDRSDREAGRKIEVPLLALWSASGPLDTWYSEGPVALWREWADNAQGHAVAGGHFFPEAAPEPTAAALRGFFAPA
jgi:pimeloyl-ACP methyl ester carboxylesterase